MSDKLKLELNGFGSINHADLEINKINSREILWKRI